MVSEVLAQFVACGFDVNDAKQVAWFEGLTDKDRADLVKMSGQRKLVTFTDAGVNENILEASRLPSNPFAKQKRRPKRGHKQTEE